MIGFFRFALMSDQITISLNELRALLRKAFEGIYGHGRDWNALTNSILWLEYRGLGGIDTFLKTEPSLHGSVDLQMIKLEAQELEFEGNSRSLMSYGLEICDLLIGRTKKHGPQIFQLKNMGDAMMVAEMVTHCAARDLSAAAWWSGEGGAGWIAFQGRTDKEPNFYKIDLPDSFQDFSEITIITDYSMKDIMDKHPEWFQLLESGKIAASEIENRYLRHLDNGILLSKLQYNTLCQLADRVLVEATEQSRRGAGE